MDLLDRQNERLGPVDLPLRGVGVSSAEVIVYVVGEIDICTAPDLSRCLGAQLEPGRHLTSLVVDLSSVTFIGVRGVAALLTAATYAQDRDVAFCLAACSRQVLRVLAVVDPDHVLTVRADPGHAGHVVRLRSSGCARTRRRSESRSLRQRC